MKGKVKHILCHSRITLRAEENLMQEKQIDVSLCRRQAGHFRAEPVAAGQPLCPGRCSGLGLEGWAFLSPWHTDSPQELKISAGCCQQWSREVALVYLFQFAISIFTVLPVGWRYHKTKKVLQEMFELQPLLQKHWTIADTKSQPTAPYHDDQATSQSRRKVALKSPSRAFWSPTWNTRVVHSERLAAGSPPRPKGLCPQPPPSRHRDDSRLSHPELSNTVACDLAYFNSEERLKDGWVWEWRRQEAVSDHTVAVP